MNTPNPLVPQGTFATKAKSPVPLTVFAILAVHVVLLGLLLIAGCNRKPSVDTAQDTSTLPPVPPPPTTPVDNWPTSSPPAVPTTPVTTEVSPVPPAPTDPIPPAQAQPIVSTPVTTAVVPPPAGGGADGLTEHTISKGESFYTLGKRYSVGYKAIVDANPGVNPNRLKPGDKVKIPPARPSGAMTVNARVPDQADGTRTYKVKSGDNLIKIATSFGVGVKQLRSANNLATDQIKVGQVLKIPAKQPAGVTPPAPAVPPPTLPVTPQ